MSDKLHEDETTVRALCAIESGLTPWELDFVESIALRVEDGGALTDRQRELAHEILRRLDA